MTKLPITRTVLSVNTPENLLFKQFQDCCSTVLPVNDADNRFAGIVSLFSLLAGKSLSTSLFWPRLILRLPISTTQSLPEGEQILPCLDENDSCIGFYPAEAYLRMQLEGRKDFEIIQTELDGLLDSSSDGIFITDGEGVVLRMNQSCAALDDVNSKEIIGKTMQDLVEAGVYRNSAALKALRRRKVVTIIQHSVTGRELLSTATPLFQGEQIHMVLVNVRDITRLTRMKNRLKRLAATTRKAKQELAELRRNQFEDDDIVCNSEVMRKLFLLARRVAEVDSTILIEGESGTGKGVLARFIHKNSPRRSGPFITIECSSIPESLLESELFGYEKGAFTGAEKRGRAGLVELAAGGTLFLDEIGEISLATQVKLLRLLQSHKFIRVGGREAINVDLRVIAATNRDLRQRVEEGKFRRDLYYRINVIPLTLPPLRCHPEDIAPLVEKNLVRIGQRYRLQKQFHPQALKQLLGYSWPGNIRELENMVEMLAVTVKGEVIGPEDLSLTVEEIQAKLPEYLGSFKAIMRQHERNLLCHCLRHFRNTQSMAEAMHIDASTIRRKLRKHGLAVKFTLDSRN